MDIRILGLGNVLMGDDGFGPYVIHALESVFEFPANVTVTDVGTPGLDLAPFLLGADVVIVVDTVRAEGAAGTIKRYRREQILKHAPPQRLGPHDPGFKQTLLALDFAGSGPREAVLVGVIPDSTLPTNHLSPAVRSAVGPAVEALLEELHTLGSPATARPVPAPIAPWWEKAA